MIYDLSFVGFELKESAYLRLYSSNEKYVSCLWRFACTLMYVLAFFFFYSLFTYFITSSLLYLCNAYGNCTDYENVGYVGKKEG